MNIRKLLLGIVVTGILLLGFNALIKKEEVVYIPFGATPTPTSSAKVKYVEIPDSTLFIGAVVSDESMTLNRLVDIYGNSLTMDDFGDLGFARVNPEGNNISESFTFTGVTANADGTKTLTGVKTADARYPYTQTAGLRRSHSIGSIVRISNTASFYDTFANKNNDEIIDGVWDFLQLPLAPTSTPTDDRQLVTVFQFNQATTTGGIDGSEIARGVWQGATQAQMASSTELGSTGAGLILQNKYTTSTGGLIGTWVPLTNASGYINATFGGVANSFATLNANSLVVQNPASATSTPTADSIVMSGGDNYINQGFLPNPLVVSSTYSIVDTSNNPIVGNTILFVTTTDFTLGNSATELNFVTTTIPANTLGTKGGLKITVSVDSTSNVSASGSCEFRVRYGGTLFTTIQLPKVISIVNMSSDIYLLSNNSTSSQIGFAFPSLRTGDGGSNQILLTSTEGTASIDSTQEQPLVFSYVRTGDTTGCTSITLERVLVTRIF